MLSSFVRIMQHMEDKHPDSQYWGDSGIIGSDGEMESQKCFLCGEELIKVEGTKKTGVEDVNN